MAGVSSCVLSLELGMAGRGDGEGGGGLPVSCL